MNVGMFHVCRHTNIDIQIYSDVVIGWVMFQATASIPTSVPETLYLHSCQERGWECSDALLLCEVYQLVG